MVTENVTAPRAEELDTLLGDTYDVVALLDLLRDYFNDRSGNGDKDDEAHRVGRVLCMASQALTKTADDLFEFHSRMEFCERSAA